MRAIRTAIDQAIACGIMRLIDSGLFTASLPVLSVMLSMSTVIWRTAQAIGKAIQDGAKLLLMS